MNTYIRKTNKVPIGYSLFFFLCGLFLALSEIWKQWYLTTVINHGTYDWWYFPFQLCSIPMYVLLILPWVKKELLRDSLLTFLMCYGLLGGIAVFADTSGLHYPAAALTIHSYLWHILLILIGIVAGHCYQSTFKETCAPAARFRSSFLGSTVIYAICCFIASCLNSLFSSVGHIDMFYINPRYPMVQIIFSNLAKYIGNTPAILLYIISTICGSLLLFLLWVFIFSKTKNSAAS